MPRSLPILAVAAVLLAIGQGALAGLPISNPATPAQTAAPPAAVALTPAEMGSISGGQEVKVEALTTQQLTASSSGNSIVAGSLTSGAVSFSPQALNGFNGVGNFVINTGANNALQGAINISIVTIPPS